MKKFSGRRLWLSVVGMIMLFAVSILPAQAETVDTVCDRVGKNTTVWKDVTGDGQADKLRFKLTKDEYGNYINKVQVNVNGKKALTLKSEGGFYMLTVQYIQIADGQQFLQLFGTADNDYLVENRIFRYDSSTGKLVKVLDLSKVNAVCGAVTEAAGRQIRIEFKKQPAETGWLHWEYTYVYKNGQFRLKSNTAAVYSSIGDFTAEDGYGAYFKNNEFVSSRSLTFYKGTGLKAKAFEAGKGDVLKLKKIRMSGGKIYLQFQKGNTRGWQRVDRGYLYQYDTDGSLIEESGWFYGVHNRLAG